MKVFRGCFEWDNCEAAVGRKMPKEYAARNDAVIRKGKEA